MAALPQAINLQQQPVDLGGGFADPMDPCTQCQMGNQELTQAIQQLTQICNACTTQQRLQQQTSGSCTECQAAQQSINQAQMQLNQMGGCSQCGAPPPGQQTVFNPQVTPAAQPFTVAGQPTIGAQPFTVAGQPIATVAQPFVVPSTVQTPFVQPFNLAGTPPVMVPQPVTIPPVTPVPSVSQPVTIPTPTPSPVLQPVTVTPVTPNVPPFSVAQPVPAPAPAPVPAPAPAPAPAPVQPVITPTLTPAQIQAAQNVAAGLSTIGQGFTITGVGTPGISLTGVPSPGLPGGGPALGTGFGAFDSNQWLLKGLQATNSIRNLL